MLYLGLLLLIVGIALMVVLFVGSMFLQGYIYTEPSPQMMDTLYLPGCRPLSLGIL